VMHYICVRKDHGDFLSSWIINISFFHTGLVYLSDKLIKMLANLYLLNVCHLYLYIVEFSFLGITTTFISLATLTSEKYYKKEIKNYGADTLTGFTGSVQ